MIRYFFNLADGGYDPDLEGTEFPDVASARREAVRFASEVLHDRPEVVWSGRDFRVEVTDHQGTLIFTFVMLVVDSPFVRDQLAVDERPALSAG